MCRFKEPRFDTRKVAVPNSFAVWMVQGTLIYPNSHLNRDRRTPSSSCLGLAADGGLGARGAVGLFEVSLCTKGTVLRKMKATGSVLKASKSDSIPVDSHCPASRTSQIILTLARRWFCLRCGRRSFSNFFVITSGEALPGIKVGQDGQFHCQRFILEVVGSAVVVSNRFHGLPCQF